MRNINNDCAECFVCNIVYNDLSLIAKCYKCDNYVCSDCCYGHNNDRYYIEHKRLLNKKWLPILPLFKKNKKNICRNWSQNDNGQSRINKYIALIYMDNPEQIFKKSSFIPSSRSAQSIDEMTNRLHRKTSIDKMIQTHNELLIHFFEILKHMEDENLNKKSKCCSIQ